MLDFYQLALRKFCFTDFSLIRIEGKEKEKSTDTRGKCMTIVSSSNSERFTWIRKIFRFRNSLEILRRISRKQIEGISFIEIEK